MFDPEYFGFSKKIKNHFVNDGVVCILEGEIWKISLCDIKAWIDSPQYIYRGLIPDNEFALQLLTNIEGGIILSESVKIRVSREIKLNQLL